MKNNIADIQKDLHSQITLSPKKATYFFKTHKGSYGEHDKFLGITVPNIRKIAKEYTHISLSQIQSLLKSPYNEERLLALIILTHQYKKNQDEIFNFYCQHLNTVNNWNLVDLSAPYIMGDYLLSKDKDLLFKLVRSENLWERRIAIVSTWWFIRKQELEPTFSLATLLLDDPEDLMHKATGWMLREAGKKDEKRLRAFLDQHAESMPRTMLRYAIEKFPKELQKHYRLKKA